MFYFLLLLFLSVNTVNACASKIKKHIENIPKNIECYLGADIGGTQSRFGIFEVKNNKPHLLASFNTKTKYITNFTEIINELMQYMYDIYGITINHACIAAPGVATKAKDYASVHGMFEIYSKELLEETPLKTAIIVNDLFVVGYGLDVIDQNNIIHLYGNIPKRKDKNKFRAIIAAGTGLGSSTMTWDAEKKQPISHAGEAGLLEFAPTNQLEYKLVNHIKNFYDCDTVFWASLASGSGIRRIYSMLKLTGMYQDSLHLDTHEPQIIFQYPEDKLCKATIDLFLKLFGRFTRNYVWSLLPYGGLYITGGVPMNNVPLFTEKFVDHYADPHFYYELKQIPVYLVNDPHVGIYGAVHYLLLETNQLQNATTQPVEKQHRTAKKSFLEAYLPFVEAFFILNKRNNCVK